MPVSKTGTHKQWNWIEYESVEKEYVRAWHVFQREKLGIQSRVSVAALFDNTRSEKNLPLKMRLLCTLCQRAAEKGGFVLTNIWYSKKLILQGSNMNLLASQKKSKKNTFQMNPRKLNCNHDNEV